MKAEMKVASPKTPLSHRISKKVLHRYQEQVRFFISQKPRLKLQNDLEVTFLCKDGKQLCSRQVLGMSEFFYFKAKNMAANINDQLEFDYTNFSHASVKLFLDSLHLIKPGPIDVAIVVECIDFIQFEGKTTLYDSFEREFAAGLLDSIMNLELPVETELVVSAYLSCVGDLDESYQQKVMMNVYNYDVSCLSDNFDLECNSNQRLIKMCASKTFLGEKTDDLLLYLMEYAKELQSLGGKKSDCRSTLETVR